MIKKYNGNKNASGTILQSERENRGVSKADLCRKLDLAGININTDELYLMEHNKLMIKDFELIAICKILEIDLNIFKDCIDD